MWVFFFSYGIFGYRERGFLLFLYNLGFTLILWDFCCYREGGFPFFFCTALCGCDFLLVLWDFRVTGKGGYPSFCVGEILVLRSVYGSCFGLVSCVVVYVFLGSVLGGGV